MGDVEGENQKRPYLVALYTVTPSLLLLYIMLVLITSHVWCNEEHWQDYLDHKYHYINHFSEMVRRKSEMYNAKRDVSFLHS